MRAIILYVFIIGSVVVMSIQSSEQSVDAQMSVKGAVQVPLKIVPVLHEASGILNHAEEVAVHLQKAEESAPAVESSDKSSVEVNGGLELNSVNGISLYDSPEAVVSKLGEPVSKSVDQLWGDLAVYEYPDMEIAFYGSFIQYVNIERDQPLMIDGETLSITESSLHKVFGQPDYIAEDGIVYQRDDAVLKLFLDEETHEPQYVSYYHIATV
ncbi:hypothetical protein [Paenibacillus paeoniae]|uniref:DUF4309 domain-containing protein n=1 Tax=Paenibacillus paeoniae TaxID=2292705 RepID=A0A371P5S5_9BACL|nr:hypothetical protein [Paenibacillus paeoniae]REK71262.1 hypothetical protein DX130_22745 [Paenibacillus paeoniae]